MSGLLIACPVCGLIQRLEVQRTRGWALCARCDTVVSKTTEGALGRTAAFSVAALMLYVPANVYPVMRMEFRGVQTESTVWDGCVRLFEDGQWLVALIVFMASMAIPVLKLLGLFYLVSTTTWHSGLARRLRTWIHKVISWIGPWAMLDVFLLAILVALVKFGTMATVAPGPGLLAFASVVVLTLMASASFEPRQIWEERTRRHEQGDRAF
jgi:paraquat-inducible protein A